MIRLVLIKGQGLWQLIRRRSKIKGRCIKAFTTNKFQNFHNLVKAVATSHLITIATN